MTASVPIAFRQSSPQAQRPLPIAPFHEWRSAKKTLWAEFFRSPPGYLIRFPRLADFTISEDGLEVECRPVPGATDATLQHLFLNQVRPLAQSRCGRLMFHASAVALEDCCIAFLGVSGSGKSTLAAAFASSGFAFLTDDCLALELGEHSCEALPSHPSLRLWEDSRTALRQQTAALAPPVQFTRKARLLAGDAMPFCGERRPLRRAYVLGDGSAASAVFEPLAPSAALIELTRHSFLLDVAEQATVASHFEQLARLVGLPIFFRLDYPRNFDSLATVISLVVQHAGEAATERDSPPTAVRGA